MYRNLIKLIVTLSSITLFTACRQPRLYSYDLQQQIIEKSVLSISDTIQNREIGSIVIKTNKNTIDIHIRDFNSGDIFKNLDTKSRIELSNSLTLERYVVLNSVLYIYRDDMNITNEEFEIPFDRGTNFKRFDVIGRYKTNRTQIELSYNIEFENNPKLISGTCNIYE